MTQLKTIYKSENGVIINADNLEVLARMKENSTDSCISDFPYDLSFMGKKWDKTENFYEWNKQRADALLRVIKPGGFVAIFGHPKTNHRMKCAFEDAGFRIVEEIDWIYLTGMPKNQDIGKLFDKSAGAERKVVEGSGLLTEPATEMAKKWNGWKTAGLKPAHEPITIFQKPLDGTYINNIELHGCGGMNIDACRIPISHDDIETLNKKASKNPTTNYSDKPNKVYGNYAEDRASPANELGRFPANIIVDEYVAELLDEQTGSSKSTGGAEVASRMNRAKNIYGGFKDNAEYINESLGGYGDSGGGSRLFTIIKYCPKVSPSERKLPNGERNPHVTLKPLELIKWLIKLLTPIDGKTIDITAGSCTHAVACEELNKNDGYNLRWINVEIMNSENETYCNVGKMRVEDCNTLM